MSKKRVLGVIGLGHVGAHVAYSLAVQGIADELVLVDKNEQKLASEVQDLRDAAAYLPHRVTVRAGDFADLGECDVIVNSVGKIELLRNFCKGIVLHTKHDDLSIYIWQSLYKLLYPRLIKQLILERLNSGMVHGIGRQFSIIFFYLLQR